MSEVSEVMDRLMKSVKEKENSYYETCPECGMQLVPAEGCAFCPSCGWSPCK